MFVMLVVVVTCCKWVWRRVEKRGGREELDLCCVFELTRCAVDLG